MAHIYKRNWSRIILFATYIEIKGKRSYWHLLNVHYVSEKVKVFYMLTHKTTFRYVYNYSCFADKN